LKHCLITQLTSMLKIAPWCIRTFLFFIRVFFRWLSLEYQYSGGTIWSPLFDWEMYGIYYFSGHKWVMGAFNMVAPPWLMHPSTHLWPPK
jgi:hypothetical protein